MRPCTACTCCPCHYSRCPAGYFPGRGSVGWRDFYTHEVLDVRAGGKTTVAAPLGHIPVHVREGAAVLVHPAPAYTVAETAASPYGLLVFQAGDGYAFGHAYFDDGESVPPTPSRDAYFRASEGRLSVESYGSYGVVPRLETVTVLNAPRPRGVTMQGREVYNWEYLDELQKLVIRGLQVDLNEETVIEWA